VSLSCVLSLPFACSHFPLLLLPLLELTLLQSAGSHTATSAGILNPKTPLQIGAKWHSLCGFLFLAKVRSLAMNSVTDSFSGWFPWKILNLLAISVVLVGYGWRDDLKWHPMRAGQRTFKWFVINYATFWVHKWSMKLVKGARTP